MPLPSEAELTGENAESVPDASGTVEPQATRVAVTETGTVISEIVIVDLSTEEVEQSPDAVGVGTVKNNVVDSSVLGLHLSSLQVTVTVVVIVVAGLVVSYEGLSEPLGSPPDGGALVIVSEGAAVILG